VTTGRTSRRSTKARKTIKPPRSTTTTAAPQTNDKKKIALLTRKLSEALQREKAASDRETAISRELSEALDQERATSQVLGIISGSPTDLEPVFETILANATRLCRASFANLWLCEGSGFHIAAVYGAVYGAVPTAYAAARPRGRMFHFAPGFPIARAAKTRRTIQITDLRTDQDYLDRDPLVVSAVELGGIRTVIFVPMLKQNESVGVITVYRQEVRPFTDRQIALVTNFASQAVIAIENARLLAELRESLEQQTATADVLKVISRSKFELQPILDTLVKTASIICGAENVVILRLEGDGLRLVAHYGPLLAPIGYVIPAVRGTVSGRSVLERRAVHVADLQAETEAYPEGSAVARELGHRTILSVPLLREGVPLGTINLRRDKVEPFTDKQIELVTTFADQAVIAIENVRLFDEVQARSRELAEALEQQTATSEILGVIAASPTNIEPVLRSLAESACRLCEAYDSVILLREHDQLRVRAHHGPIPMDFAEWPIGRGWVTGRAVVDREPVHVHDLQASVDEFPDGSTFALRLGHRTILAVPLLREGEAIGALTIRRTEVKPFTDKQIALVGTFADQAVIAIENVRLFEEVQARSRELAESLEQQTVTSEVLSVISSSPGELEPVFQAMLANATRICEAEFGNMLLYRDGSFQTVAMQGGNRTANEIWSREALRPGPDTGFGRLVTTKQIVHLADASVDAAYVNRDPLRVAIVELLGARTLLTVPMLKDDELSRCVDYDIEYSVLQNHHTPFEQVLC
jgi:GAF domain-containing protein